MAEKKIKIAVHTGRFHADDVFSAAALLLFLNNGHRVLSDKHSVSEKAEVLRTRDPKIIESADFVADVGGVYDANKNRFDHHQKDGAGMRTNGISYAAFGLVWKKFGAEISGSAEISALVEKTLVEPLDAHDNGVDIVLKNYEGVFPYEIGELIYSFNPTWEEEALYDKFFEEALFIAQKILLRAIANAKSIVGGEKIVREFYKKSEDKRIIVLDNRYPWECVLMKFPEPLFAVYPQNNEWRVKCVRDEPESFKNRKNLPEEWAGLRDFELAKIAGVPDAVFCHRNSFFAVAKSKEGAIALARKAL